jgi:two-component sensor histidine kinase
MAGDARTIVWTADATKFLLLLTTDQRRAIAAALVRLSKGSGTSLVRSVAELPGIYEVACDAPAHGLRIRITFRENAILVLGFVAPRPR